MVLKGFFGWEGAVQVSCGAFDGFWWVLGVVCGLLSAGFGGLVWF